MIFHRRKIAHHHASEAVAISAEKVNGTLTNFNILHVNSIPYLARLDMLFDVCYNYFSKYTLK
jgi:hypothetical protein